MKGIRVRILNSFNSIHQFHSSIPYDHNQYSEKFPFRIPQNHPINKVNNKISIKDEAEDSYQECDEEALHNEDLEMDEHKCQPEGNNAVILYTTSLRGIRKTFKDCQSIKFLLDSFQIVYHERDVSMNLEFRDELWEILNGRIIPPRLFIKGRHVGGADEVVSLHERGELKNLLQGIPHVLCNQKCKGCDNLRFVVCCDCHGSRKVFHDGSFCKCIRCNENGLIKCTLCF